MANRRSKSRRRRRKERTPLRRPRPAELARAQSLWQEGKGPEAVAILDDLVERYPRDLDSRLLLGSVYVDLGYTLVAINHLEVAAKLSRRNPEVLFLLGGAYWQHSLSAHTLLTLRECLQHKLREETAANVRAAIEDATENIRFAAAEHGISPRKMEHAVYLMEDGRLAAQRGESADAVKASREAARLVRNWAPPRNNLALAQFALGHWNEAIATAEEVLERIDDQNVHALGNLVRFLTASGDTDRAQYYMTRLENAESTDPDRLIKVAEAYAVLEKDSEVYATLKNAQVEGDVLDANMLQLLGTAAANLGTEREALALWKEPLLLDLADSRLGDYMDALRHGIRKSAPAYRFPYFPGHSMVPEQAFVDFVGRLGALRMSEEKTTQEMRGFGEKYPYVADIFSDLLWYGDENEQVNSVHTLRMLGNERAVVALRDFAQSQLGADDPRMMAAVALLEMGIFSEDEPVRLWLKGEWREVLLRGQFITEAVELEYSDETIDLLDEAIAAGQAGKDRKAESLYKRIIALEPTAKEAYGNLGVIYVKQGREEEAERLLQKAIETDPDYVHARCNLASIRITQGRLEEAEELLKPVAERKTINPRELRFYHRIRVDLLVAQEDYEAAEQYLEMMLKLDSDDEHARRLLRTVRMINGSRDLAARWREQTRQTRERRRRRPLKGTDLQSLLPRHIKDNLLAMARALDINLPSGIRKAELTAILAESLGDPEVVGRAWRGLTDEDREALTFVLVRGGMVPYGELGQVYGDDLTAPYYWHGPEAETTIGRLRLHGLLFEGRYEDEVVLVIPTEVRGLLAALQTE